MHQKLEQEVKKETASTWTLSDPESADEDSVFLKATHEAGSTLAVEENGEEVGIIFTHGSGRQEYISVCEEDAVQTVLEVTREYQAAYEIDSQSDTDGAEDRYFAVINPAGLQPVTFCREGGDDMVYYRATYAAISAIRVRSQYKNEGLQVAELSQEWIGAFSDSGDQGGSTPRSAT